MPSALTSSLLLFVTSLASATDLYDIDAADLQSGLPVHMSFYRGKVLLIVNVASQCGYTDSTYKMLNSLHTKYNARGLEILAFPCNAFGAQEPGSPEEIFRFVDKTKAVKFDVFRKVEVSGASAHPLFKWLLGESGDCADEEASCAVWAQQGECQSNPEFMRTSCRLSCKHCTAPEGKGQPIRWNFESFLVSRTGEKAARWVTGTDLTAAAQTRQIEALLEAKTEL